MKGLVSSTDKEHTNKQTRIKANEQPLVWSQRQGQTNKINRWFGGAKGLTKNKQRQVGGRPKWAIILIVNIDHRRSKQRRNKQRVAENTNKSFSLSTLTIVAQNKEQRTKHVKHKRFEGAPKLVKNIPCR